MTESYFESNYRYYESKLPGPWGNRTQNTIDQSKYEQQKARYIGRCDIYMSANNGLNVGIIGKRRAVVETKTAETWSGGGDNGHDYYSNYYSYGELYVLVIARQ